MEEDEQVVFEFDKDGHISNLAGYNYLKSLKDRCDFRPRFITTCEPAKEGDVSITFQVDAIHYHLCIKNTNILRIPGWLADRLPERYVSHTYVNARMSKD